MKNNENWERQRNKNVYQLNKDKKNIDLHELTLVQVFDSNIRIINFMNFNLAQFLFIAPARNKFEFTKSNR